MKRITILTCGILVAGALAFTSTTWARQAQTGKYWGLMKRASFFQQRNREAGKHSDRERQEGRRGERNQSPLGDLSRLDLSEEQQAQVKKLSETFRLSTAKSRTQIRFIRRDLRTEIRKDGRDQAVIDNLWNDIAALRQQVAEAQAEHFLALRAILTPEQLKKLQQDPLRAATQELQELRAELRTTLLTVGDVDTAKVKELQTNIAEKEIELAKTRREMRSQRQKSANQADTARDTQ